MDAVLLAQLQGLLGLLSEARVGIEGNAALLRSVNSNLASLLRKLQTRAQHTGDTVTQPAALRAPLRLPPEFVDLQEMYASLQDPLNPAAAAAGQSVTTTAAAAFLHSLDAVYGHQAQGSAVQPPSRGASLGVQQFADQAHFVGLVAAVLSAVQALTARGSTSSSTQPSSLSTAQLQQAVPALLQQCNEWLQAHSSPAQHLSDSAGQQQALHAEVARWRNRALRSIAATASAQAAAVGRSTAASAVAAAAPKLPDVWLPQQCWDPLSVAVGSQPAWHLLLPHPADTHHRPQQAASRMQLGSSSTDTVHMSGAAAAAAVPVLAYSEVSEVVQYSRQAQKVQQLLLQLAVESQPAPQLLHTLLQCCQQLQQQAAGNGPAGSGSVSHDCCCALYRLACALAAGPVKERGLGAGCQLAVEAEVPDDSGR